MNTSRVVDEDMRALDEEPEIISALPASGWHAVVGGELVALVAFAALDDGRMHGVVLGEDGRIDLNDDVEKHLGFSGYKQANTSDKGNN